MKSITSAAGAPAAVGPYSQAIRAGDTVYCSGQLPVDPATGELLTGEIGDLARCAIANLQAVLAAAGATLGDVVKCTVFMTDLAEFPAMNAAYAELFGSHKPARSTIQVAALPLGARLEIEAVAVIGAGD